MAVYLAGEYWEDTQARQEPQVEGNLSEIPKSSTQQEPAYTVAAASEEMAKHWDNSIVTTTKREPVSLTV